MKELKSWESRIYLPVNKQYSRRTKYSSKKGTLQPKNDKKLSPVKNYEHRVCRWKFVEGYVKTKSYPSMSRAARAFAMARGRYNRDCHSVKCQDMENVRMSTGKCTKFISIWIISGTLCNISLVLLHAKNH